MKHEDSISLALNTVTNLRHASLASHCNGQPTTVSVAWTISWLRTNYCRFPHNNGLDYNTVLCCQGHYSLCSTVHMDSSLWN